MQGLIHIAEIRNDPKGIKLRFNLNNRKALLNSH